MANPIVTITDISTTRISQQPTKNISDIKFTIDKDIQQFEVRAVKVPGVPSQGVGILVEKDDAIRCDETLVCDEILPCSEYFLAQGIEQPADITAPELTDGEGDYTITAYVRDTDGNWSD